MTDPDYIEQLHKLLQDLTARYRHRHYLLITEPSRETAVRAAVDAQDWGVSVVVLGSQTCPPGQVLMNRIDPMQYSMLRAAEDFTAQMNRLLASTSYKPDAMAALRRAVKEAGGAEPE